MTVSIVAIAAASLACAALMGFAIQRGATCTVAAVDELLRQRRARRLLALVEASAWVAGGLLLARLAGWLPQAPPAYALGGGTIAGAVLLGLGAFVNRACVFGAIARLGNGELAYVLTPLGFFAGCVTLPLLGPAPPAVAVGGSPLDAAPAALAWLLGAAALPRAALALKARVWSPHVATSVIGVTFVVLLLLAGPWAYTDALAEAAHGMAQDTPLRLALFGCLLGGASLGGWSAGGRRLQRPTAATALRCFSGGVMMGWGSLLIPGSNDGLILVGLPLLRPYAWAAFATMLLTIAAAMALSARAAAASRETASRAAPPGAA